MWRRVKLPELVFIFIQPAEKADCHGLFQHTRYLLRFGGSPGSWCKALSSNMSLLQAKFEKEPEDYRISLFLNIKVFQCFEIVIFV